ncbi:DsrE family protein [Salipiger bermudensis]|uniref:DsrE family protein n=1 Tax=Salipiger bermudensis TaxID=344736 RepID=UPI001C99D7EA|nr:DsrE family protein [Salipiger bermudensis]MBY6002568.1 DsrE family protein [Salipiger bermudensis]
MIKTVALAALLAAAPLALLAEGKTHHVAFHVDQNDPHVLNMALNNAKNLTEYYTEQGDEVKIEMVAYGPGLHMLIEGKSPVKDRIETLSLELPITFSACGNTIAGIEKKTGAPVTLLEEAQVVTSGVARLVELQEEGYSYIRP